MLSDAELGDRAGVFGGEVVAFDPDWIPHEALYRRSIDCAADIRDALANPYADEWAILAARFAERLGDPHMWLHDGIAMVREWVGEVWRLLRAMAAK